MSDPLSVAASIAGLISITVEAVKFLSPYVSAAKETPQVAAHVYSEVQSTQVILMGLQSLTKNLRSVNVQHAALIEVNQVVAILTDGVLLYSELHKELQSLWSKDGVEKVPLRGRLQWVWKESTFVTLLNRLQSFKSSMTLVLMILQSDSCQTAKEHQEQLSNNVKALLDNNNALSRRLMNLEDALDAQTIISRRMSILSLSASPSGNATQQLTAESPVTSITTENSLAISKFDFEDDLESSRVYRRAVRETMDYSFRSSIARSHSWSVFSVLSLGDVSIMSVIALPVYQDDITNAEHYDFGEEPAPNAETHATVTGQPLLIECLELKLKLLTIPGMSRYFDEILHSADDFSHLWSVLEQATPLAILAQALDPTQNLDVGLPEDLTDNARKELVLWFAQFCHDKLDIQTRNLITVQDLMGGSSYSIFKARSYGNTEARKVANCTAVKAQVDAQPPELQKLLTEQRQFVRDLDELLEMKDQLEMLSGNIFHWSRDLAATYVTFGLIIERNLLLPLTHQIWAPAFDFILILMRYEASYCVYYSRHRASIQLWLKEGRFKDEDKTRESLARCLYLLPTRAKRISMLFDFSEYLKGQPMATEEQKKDRSRSQSSIAKIVSQLQDKDISRDTVTAVQELQQRIEDWKGIRPGDLGEMILCKTLYVTKSSKTHLVSCLCMTLSITSNVPAIVSRVSFPEHASPLQRGSWSKLRRVIVLQVEILIRTEADKIYTEGTIPPETYNLGHSNIQTCNAFESEMRTWASKIDEYRMMAILMARPKTDSEELDSPIDENTGRAFPWGVSKEPWKRYGLIK
ncbi:Rho guanine nucleotide exchange factor scd1 [Fusarium tjaetaba]|uniref:Rho guanine nucleotide exchange factor scd1 n=1 Tax=Fusarium tjaetaba TaxID=1567544 RepID=A0A8H5VEA1_9HYPO|nr:Rho guanine nucleotide exchange factor scd1 [Fusarium tjaetaba]KAF5621332.1 Rho guanine nucleotide exchange factor scd1 [Fusarium tjaetaba]